ncbi:hypothetical protein PSEUBRA_000090 [Kalmanozyma brasiliensis GHG001]|uniref:Uncharacterized protein n=1 Tax=Kalmanozyma brasiliensis (strain GHG001) TaxID=1365824 RepID=V5EW21_KALBG|nr:uncharacterized protein PSEUBRA_000090 [Kalmanozyma brasiliensis GHG001]EST09715.1 hypothetical protein PSEUBRA_000090 [Kalmanozyma brasiliensis GHG001]
MAPLAKTMAVVAALAAPALVAATSNLQIRQYQDPNSQLVVNNPACDFYQCTIYWVPGTQVQVNWANPPSGTVQVDLMTNNNSDVAYNIGTAPAVSSTCDAGAGYGNPGPNGAQCGGFVFTVPSSWNAGNYTSLRAISVQNQDIQSYTDKIYITKNSTTSNDVPLSIVSGTAQISGSTQVGGSSTAAASGSTTRTSGSAGPTSSGATSSRTGGSVSMTSTRSGSSPSASSGSSSGALSSFGGSATTLSLAAAAAFALGVGSLL